MTSQRQSCVYQSPVSHALLVGIYNATVLIVTGGPRPRTRDSPRACARPDSRPLASQTDSPTRLSSEVTAISSDVRDSCGAWASPTAPPWARHGLRGAVYMEIHPRSASRKPRFTGFRVFRSQKCRKRLRYTLYRPSRRRYLGGLAALSGDWN